MNKNLYHSSLEVDVQRVLNDDTPFGVKEAYRALYTNIRYLPIESQCKRLVVTSAYPGEGKTSISVNLAITIAMNSPESKILLVDADMRSPRVADLLEIRGELHGLSEYLASIDSEPNFVETSYSNLSFLPSGAANINTPGLISSSRMKSLVALVSEKFDYVIFDTPPVNVVSDAILLSESVDGYILATRSDFSDVNSLSEAVKNLDSAEARIFGIVLCSFNAKSGKKYGKYSKYGKYGRYGKYARYGKDDGFAEEDNKNI